MKTLIAVLLVFASLSVFAEEVSTRCDQANDSLSRDNNGDRESSAESDSGTEAASA